MISVVKDGQRLHLLRESQDAPDGDSHARGPLPRQSLPQGDGDGIGERLGTEIREPVIIRRAAAGLAARSIDGGEVRR